MAKEALAPGFAASTLQLVADDPAGGQTGLAAHFLEPVGKLRCKTNRDGMTHIAEL